MAIQNISFKGGSIPTSGAVNLGPEVKKYVSEQAAQKTLLDAMPKTVKTLNKMQKILGGNEAVNICINALGTGLIAPLFIKYNFLSKSDQDTRTYSAWRQPVSAVLSVVTQAGILIPINRWMNKLSNEGKLLGFDMYNQGGYQNEGYLKKRIKKANPKATKKEIDELLKAEQNKQLQGLVDSINDKNTISFVDKNKKTVTMPQKKFNNMVNGILDKKAEDYNENIKRYESEKLDKQIASDLYKFKNQSEVKEFLRDAKKQASAGDFNKMQKWLNIEIEMMQKLDKAPELIKIATDISKRPDIETIQHKIKNNIVKINKISEMKTEEEVINSAAQAMTKSTASAESKIKNISEIKQQLKDGKTVKEVLNGLEKGHPLKESLVMDIAQKYTESIGKNLKGWYAISGLAISFAMLPVTCDLLNRLYPVFMDKFFPELSNKKKAGPQPKAAAGSDKTEEANK